MLIQLFSHRIIVFHFIGPEKVVQLIKLNSLFCVKQFMNNVILKSILYMYKPTTQLHSTAQQPVIQEAVIFFMYTFHTETVRIGT